METHSLNQVEMNFGCPKHFKGEWDGMAGCLKGALEAAALEASVLTIKDPNIKKHNTK